METTSSLATEDSHSYILVSYNQTDEVAFGLLFNARAASIGVTMAWQLDLKLQHGIEIYKLTLPSDMLAMGENRQLSSQQVKDILMTYPSLLVWKSHGEMTKALMQTID